MKMIQGTERKKKTATGRMENIAVKKKEVRRVSEAGGRQPYVSGDF